MPTRSLQEQNEMRREAVKLINKRVLLRLRTELITKEVEQWTEEQIADLVFGLISSGDVVMVRTQESGNPDELRLGMSYVPFRRERQLEQVNEKLINALRLIHLGSQNSMTTKEDLGKECRKALADIGEL